MNNILISYAEDPITNEIGDDIRNEITYNTKYANNVEVLNSIFKLSTNFQNFKLILFSFLYGLFSFLSNNKILITILVALQEINTEKQGIPKNSIVFLGVSIMMPFITRILINVLNKDLTRLEKSVNINILSKMGILFKLQQLNHNVSNYQIYCVNRINNFSKLIKSIILDYIPTCMFFILILSLIIYLVKDTKPPKFESYTIFFVVGYLIFYIWLSVYFVTVKCNIDSQNNYIKNIFDNLNLLRSVKYDYVIDISDSSNTYIIQHLFRLSKDFIIYFILPCLLILYSMDDQNKAKQQILNQDEFKKDNVNHKANNSHVFLKLSIIFICSYMFLSNKKLESILELPVLISRMAGENFEITNGNNKLFVLPEKYTNINCIFSTPGSGKTYFINNLLGINETNYMTCGHIEYISIISNGHFADDKTIKEFFSIEDPFIEELEVKVLIEKIGLNIDDLNLKLSHFNETDKFLIYIARSLINQSLLICEYDMNKWPKHLVHTILNTISKHFEKVLLFCSNKSLIKDYQDKFTSLFMLKNGEISQI